MRRIIPLVPLLLAATLFTPLLADTPATPTTRPAASNAKPPSANKGRTANQIDKDIADARKQLHENLEPYAFFAATAGQHHDEVQNSVGPQLARLIALLDERLAVSPLDNF